jgi:hypothetical protein
MLDASELETDIELDFEEDTGLTELLDIPTALLIDVETADCEEPPLVGLSLLPPQAANRLSVMVATNERPNRF